MNNLAEINVKRILGFLLLVHITKLNFLIPISLKTDSFDIF